MKELYCCASLVFNLLNSQGLENLIVGVSAYFAIKTYMADVKHKKMQMTLDVISAFLDGNWVSIGDKKNWNCFITVRMCTDSCAKFSFTGKFVSYSGKCDGLGGQQPIELDIADIFTEGPEQNFGDSIFAIMQMLEFIAEKTNKNELDENLIRIRLLRFYQLADYFNSSIKINDEENSFPAITKLYKTLKESFGATVPYGENYTFDI